MPTFNFTASHWSVNYWAQNYWAANYWFTRTESINTDTAVRYCLDGTFNLLDTTGLGTFVIIDTDLAGTFAVLAPLNGTWPLCGD